jgi:N4-gp56 family major capsid protein
VAITKALPTVWSARIKENLLKAHVFGSPAVVNREHEGEITDAGQSVKIISISPIAIKAYTKDTDIASPDALTDAETILAIDQQWYFNFGIDDIDQVQTKPKLMNEAARTAAWGLIEKSDAKLAADMVAGALAGNAVTATAASGGAYDALVDADTKLSGQNIPQGGRFAVCSPSFYAYLRKDDRFVHATATGDTVLRTGQVGQAAGFQVLQSNNAPAGKVIAGHPMATTFAEQILKTEAFRPQNRFGDALKGLYVYGDKVVYGEALSVITWT